MLPQSRASSKPAAIAAPAAETDSAGKAIARFRLLLSSRGEVSGEHIARQALASYELLRGAALGAFFDTLAADFSQDPAAIVELAGAYERSPSPDTLAALQQAIEPPRRELFRRLNTARGGTAALVEMRRRVLDGVPKHPSWAAIASDLAHLFRSWFNGGFLELRRIDMNTSPRVLGRLIKYEAVHAIHSLDELHRRLQSDRRCFALFHSALPNEPLVFTEIALTPELGADVQRLLDAASPVVDPAMCRCAMFYSISSCHEGLRGITFGNTLIRRAVDALRRELPQLRTFATLSPVPGFRAWLEEAARTRGGEIAEIVAKATVAQQREDPDLQRELISLCASYLLFAKRGNQPVDPVARFHLGNGARLERLNWMGDPSATGIARSLGLTANYVYSPSDIDRNHEQYSANGKIAASHRIELLAVSAPL